MTKRELLLRAIGLASQIVALFVFPTPVAASIFVANAAGDLDDGPCGADDCPLLIAGEVACRNPG